MSILRKFNVFRGKKNQEPEPVPAPVANVTIQPNIEYTVPDVTEERAPRVEAASQMSGAVSAYEWLAKRFAAFFQTAVDNSPLNGLQETIQAGMRSGATIEAAYTDRHNAAEAEFRDAVRAHVDAIVEGRSEVDGKKNAVRADLEAKQQELKNRQYQLTGEPNRAIDPVSWFRFGSISLLMLVIILGLETGLTAGILAFYSDPQTAQLMSLAIATVLTVFATVWGSMDKVLSSARDSKKRNEQFLRRRGINSTDTQYRQLPLWEPEELITKLYEGAKWGYLLTSSGWFLVRLIAVLKNTTSDNTVGLLVAGMVSVIGYVGKILVSIFFPPYGIEHNKLKELQDEADDLADEIEDFDASKPTVPAEVAVAAGKFKDAADIAWNETVTGPINSIRQAVANALFVGEKLGELRSTIRNEFVVEAADAYGAILGREADEKGGDENQPTLKVTFKKSEALQHLELPPDDAFLASLWTSPINPETIAPKRRAAEPNAILADMLGQVKPKPKPTGEGRKARQVIVNIED